MRYIEVKLDGTSIQMEPVTIRQYNNLVDTVVVQLKSDMDGLVVEDYNVFIQTDLVRRDKIPLTPCRSSVDIVVEEGYLGYTWPIDSAVTRYKGVLQFEVQLEHKTDAAIPIWQSEVCKLITVAPNICDNTALGDDGPAILQEVYQQLQMLDDQAEQAAASAADASESKRLAATHERTAKSHAEQTGEDRIATGEDRVATGADRSAVNTALTGFTETTLPNAVQAVEDKADTEIARVGQAGDTQIQAVNAAGAEQIGLATAQADRAEGSASAADAALNKLVNLDVSAETLAPGSNATVSKTETETGYTLAFGVPRGDKGERGDKGDTGDVNTVQMDAAISAAIAPVTSQLAASVSEHNAVAGYGVVSGLSVSRKLPVAMKVKVEAGVCYLPNYKMVSPVYAEPSLAAADETNPRIDLVYVNVSGVVVVVTGTPAANPVAPSTPSGGVALAEIYVGAGVTSVDTAQITDVRVWKYTNPELGAGYLDLKRRFEDEIYTISEIPIYADKTLAGATGLFSSLEILDTHYFALACPYGLGKQEFWKVDPVTLQQSLLFTTTQGTLPYWQCAKILPRGAADLYDFIIAFDYNTKQVFRLSTNGVIQTAFAAQKFGWLRNTGIDWVPTAAGLIANKQTIIYVEYMLTSYDNYASTTEVKVWRSTDRGATWTNVHTFNNRNHASPEIYHGHFTRRDPYNAGHWYIGTGDNPEECHIYRSIDDGITWTCVDDPAFVGTEKQEIHRTCNMYFTAEYIYWGMDGYTDLDGMGTQWVRAKRNLAGNSPLTIEPLFNLGNYVRNTIQTPYGILLLTEKRDYDTTNSLVWLVKYNDLTHPILIDRLPTGYGDQIMEYSYGGRIFVKDSEHANYGYAPAGRSKFYVMTLSKSVRGSY